MRTDFPQPLAPRWQRDVNHNDWIERVYPDVTEWFQKDGPALIVIASVGTYWSVLDYRVPPHELPTTIAGPFDSLDVAKVAYLMVAYN